MKTILILSALILVGCSGIRTKFNEEDSTQVRKLQVRCEIESEDLYKAESKELMPIYCECMLKSLGNPNILKTKGAEAAIKNLSEYYIISSDISRAIMSENQERIDRFPKDMILSTGRQMDKCLDQAKSFFYEKEMDQRIKSRMGV